MSKAEAYVAAGCNSAPRPLAEHLAPNIASAALKHFEARRNPEGLFRSAWNTVEFALNQETNLPDQTRRYHMESAQNLIGWVINTPEAHADTQHGALVLSSYILILTKRALNQGITTKDCTDLYQSLGSVIRHLQPTSDKYPPPWRMTETAILAASARISRPELLLYPTSPREEASSTPRFNHDSYFVIDSEKIPIQQKFIDTEQHTYDDWIRILEFEPLLKKAYKKSQLKQPDSSSAQLNHTLSLIVAESNNEILSKQERAFLNNISEGVAFHYIQARQSSYTGLAN